MKITKAQWLERFNQVHGNKYDYSKAIFVNQSTKIEIICSKHGVFWQTPKEHFKSKGCPYCSNKRNNNETFIEKAKQIHGDKYDYSLINYINQNTKIKIICPIHGIFEQTPKSHIVSKHGCPKCGKTFTREEFIEKAKQVHGDKYDYSLVDYKNERTIIRIICPIHGIFEQMPHIHLNGKGCQKCGLEICASSKRSTTKEFIEKAKQVHGDKYDYSLVDYKNNNIKVKIICPDHGMFQQRPADHLYGHGCPSCYFSRGESYINVILKNKKINFIPQKSFDDLKDTLPLRYDFYLPDYNLLIEYNGGQHYKPIKRFGGHKKFLIQKHHDWLKRKYAKNHNIKLLTIPYWEFKNIETILEENL